MRSKRARSGVRPALVSGSQQNVTAEVLRVIPAGITPGKLTKRRAAHGGNTPLARYLASEVGAILRDLQFVRLSLEEVLAFQRGGRSVSPAASVTLRSLVAGKVPASWPRVPSVAGVKGTR